MRMERLQEKRDDPEREHLPDWPIMLKANLGIGVTGDDPDWWEEPIVEVAGAGSSVNGEFAELNSYGGQQQYEHSGTYIRYDRAASRWIITDATDTVYYHCATLEGTWEVDAGTGPAPTVTLDWPQEYGLHSCAIEDVYNWSNYAYLLIGLYAPVDGTVTLAVTYKVPTVADSCYTGFTYRFGDWAEEFGGWEYSASTFTLTYDIRRPASSIVDLCCNNEAADRRVSHPVAPTSSSRCPRTPSDQLGAKR